jgi:mannose/cellobiose epimerase-like protein (N-acyl-D-glucosamine 2-epimerase family)
MLTGDEAYLTWSRRALEFIYRNAWDAANGGWFQDLNENGVPASPGGTKSAFYQHYALLGIAASVEATGDTSDWRWLLQGVENNESRLWDSGESTFGYYDSAQANWSARWAKSFNATVDAITTHALHLYLLTGEEHYRQRLADLRRNILERLVPSMDAQAIGFAEIYQSDWSANGSQTMTIMGHVLKTGWCLARLHEVDPDPADIPAAEKLVQNVLAKGYDHAFGGPYKDYDRTTGQMLMWGQADTAKAWWQMEQAVTAGLMLYELTGNESYLTMADGTLDFFMRYFVDRTYGEVYSDRSRYGALMWNDAKGSSGKAGYHSTELGYYVYLYGTLLLRKEPATLHYRFAPLLEPRAIRLSPLAYGPGKYRVRSVLKDGAAYAAVDNDARILTLPAGVGGHFTVTYEPVGATSVAAAGALPTEAALEQNYPNPFNPSTLIRFSLPRGADIRLSVYDLLGREVALLSQGETSAGMHEVRFDAPGLASGVYIARLTLGEPAAGPAVLTRRMILLH